MTNQTAPFWNLYWKKTCTRKHDTCSRSFWYQILGCVSPLLLSSNHSNVHFTRHILLG